MTSPVRFLHHLVTERPAPTPLADCPHEPGHHEFDALDTEVAAIALSALTTQEAPS